MLIEGMGLREVGTQGLVTGLPASGRWGHHPPAATWKHHAPIADGRNSLTTSIKWVACSSLP